MFFTFFWILFFSQLGNTEMPDWDAKGFANTSKWAKATAYDVIEIMQFQGSESLLDVGTGDGKICSVMANKTTGEVIGIDPSKEMISYAREHFPKKDFPNLHFQMGDAENFQSNKRFDKITSFTAMHLVVDQEKALKNLASLLQPGGKIFLKFPTSDGFETALERTLQLPQWKKLFADYHPGWFFKNKKDYEGFIQDAGLDLIHIEEGILDECYDSKEELRDAISYWLPHLRILNLEQQKYFLNDLISLFMEEVPLDSFGKIHHFEPFLFTMAGKSVL